MINLENFQDLQFVSNVGGSQQEMVYLGQANE